VRAAKVATSRRRPLVFVLGGNGCQYPMMARSLYATSSVARATLERCMCYSLDVLHVDLRRLLLGAEGDSFENPVRQRGSFIVVIAIETWSRLTHSQPPASAFSREAATIGLAAVQAALADALASLGLRPDLIVGHSAGETAAAYMDGCSTLEQVRPGEREAATT